MIFATIGTQAPFDRLLEAIDNIAPDINERIVAQVVPSNFKARNVEIVNFLTPNSFDKLFNEASIIVSHAGMGTIISALTQNKPIIVMPRIARLGEHRNEHQLATAKKMSEMGYVSVADDEIALKHLIKEYQNKNPKNLMEKQAIIGEFASDRLIQSIRKFIMS